MKRKECDRCGEFKVDTTWGKRGGIHCRSCEQDMERYERHYMEVCQAEYDTHNPSLNEECYG